MHDKRHDSSLPPFRTIDVRNIKGEPPCKFMRNDVAREEKEEWVYFNNDKREHFIFRNGLLAGYLETAL